MKTLKLSKDQRAKLAVYDKNVADVLAILKEKPDMYDAFQKIVIVFGLALDQLDRERENKPV
jgi:3-dehydroquinate dehydratase